MIVSKPESSELKPNPFNADVRVLFDSKKTEVLHLKLEANKNLRTVRIDNDAFFYILEGKPEVIINEDKKIVSAEAFVFCKGGSNHCINNPNNEPARILVVKLLS